VRGSGTARRVVAVQRGSNSRLARDLEAVQEVRAVTQNSHYLHKVWNKSAQKAPKVVLLAVI
jgi:hypothetical protein